VHNSHTCSLRCIFVHVHAAAKNDLDGFAASAANSAKPFSTVWEQVHLDLPFCYILWFFRSKYIRKIVDPSRMPTAIMPAMAAVNIPRLANSSIRP